MRLVVHNFAKGGPLGFALHGIIVSGRLTVGDRILMLPCGEVGICKGDSFPLAHFGEILNPLLLR